MIGENRIFENKNPLGLFVCVLWLEYEIDSDFSFSEAFQVENNTTRITEHR